MILITQQVQAEDDNTVHVHVLTLVPAHKLRQQVLHSLHHVKFVNLLCYFFKYFWASNSVLRN